MAMQMEVILVMQTHRRQAPNGKTKVPTESDGKSLVRRSAKENLLCDRRGQRRGAKFRLLVFEIFELLGLPLGVLDDDPWHAGHFGHLDPETFEAQPVLHLENTCTSEQPRGTSTVE